MKKLITLSIAFLFLSCNDGDFDVPIFEFTSDVESCGEYILYIANSNNTEVLALSLNTTHINTNLGENPFAISTAMVNYRIFDEGIAANYFCQSIPPSTPKIIKELIAESGTINITTEEILTNDIVTGYTHTISITNLLFNDNDERIFLENLEFGDFIVNL